MRLSISSRTRREIPTSLRDSFESTPSSPRVLCSNACVNRSTRTFAPTKCCRRSPCRTIRTYRQLLGPRAFPHQSSVRWVLQDRQALQALEALQALQARPADATQLQDRVDRGTVAHQRQVLLHPAVNPPVNTNAPAHLLQSERMRTIQWTTTMIHHRLPLQGLWQWLARLPSS